MEFFEAQEGVYTGEIPAEFGSGRPEEVAAASAARPAPPTSTEEPREKKPRRTEPPPPKSGKKREKPRRTKPWPDTHGVALRSSAQMERMGGVAPPLGPLHRLFSRWRERGRQLGRLAGSEGISSSGAEHSTKVSSASIDATYASQGRADVGCGNGVNGPSSTSAGSGANGSSCASAAFGGTAYVQLDPQLLQHWSSGDLLFAFGRVLPYTAPAGPGYTSRAGRVGSCQGRGPGSAGQGEDVVFASAATLGGSSGADSRAGGIIDDGAFAAPPAPPPLVAWVIMPPPRPPRREASPPPSPR